MMERLKSEILHLDRLMSQGRRKPHKLIMLLTVLEMFERDPLRLNEIEFDETLERDFKILIRRFGSSDDWDGPTSPYFHLKTSPFWNLEPWPGKESELEALTRPGGGRRLVQDVIQYAYLAEYAVAVLRDDVKRAELRGFLQGILMSENIHLWRVDP